MSTTAISRTSLPSSTRSTTDKIDRTYGTITFLKPYQPTKSQNVKKDHTTKLPSSTTTSASSTRAGTRLLLTKRSSTVVSSTKPTTTKRPERNPKERDFTESTTFPSTTTTSTRRPVSHVKDDRTTASTTRPVQQTNNPKLSTISSTTTPTPFSANETRYDRKLSTPTSTKSSTETSKDVATTPSLSTVLPTRNPKMQDDKIPLDFIPSKEPDPVSFETKQLLIHETNDIMSQQAALESQASLEGVHARRKELEMRYALNRAKLRRLREHAFFRRMLQSVTEQMIEERRSWHKYKPNPQIKDTVSTRLRIQSELSDYFLEYAIKFGKRPWLNPGKNKIKTKFYEHVDFVDKPFIVTEEKTETQVQHEVVKAKRGGSLTS